MKNNVLEYLKNQILGTVATVNADGSPEAALVGFSYTDDLRLFFATSNQTRKYNNLQNSPNVAIVIADFKAEIQYEGTAKEVTDAVYRQEVSQRHIQRIPGADKFLSGNDQAYFEIIPTWIRFTQHGAANEVTEMTEF